jgi:predicted nucleic acid-binding protein
VVGGGWTVVNCAVAGRADFIITHDKHFNVLQHIQFPKIKTLKLDDFQRVLAI